VLVRNELVPHRLLCLVAAVAQTWYAVDHVADEMERVENR